VQAAAELEKRHDAHRGSPGRSSGSTSRRRIPALLALTTAFAFLAILGSAPAQAENPGSVKTSNSDCDVANENLYALKTDVFVSVENFGPDAFLYFKVESPEGDLLVASRVRGRRRSRSTGAGTSIRACRSGTTS
jgi:hypothetical protein